MLNRFILTLSILLLALPLQAAKNEALEKAREAASHEEWEQAAEFAKQATTSEPDNEAAWSVLGDAQFALGDTTGAISSYEKSVAIEPKYPQAVLSLTSYYIKQNRMDDAERVVSKAEERDKKQRIDEIKVARGLILAKQGDFSQATMILASATAKNPKNHLYPQILARLYNDASVKEQAASYYEQAWKLAPGDPVLAYEYALVLQDLQKYNEALELFKKVQERDPKNKSVDYMIGRLYYASKRYAEAATQFEKAVEKRPDHFLSHFLLGKSYLEFSKEEKKNFYAKAEKSLRRALELKPDRKDIAALCAEACLNQGKAYYQRGAADTTGVTTAALCDTAIFLTHEALELNPEIVGGYSQLARVWSKNGNLDSAAHYSRLQLAQTPNDPIEFSRLVNTLQRKKDFAGLAETIKPVFDSLDWSKPKAQGDTTAYAQDKFIDKFSGAYVNAMIETGKSKEAREAMKLMLGYNPLWCDGHSLNAYIELKRQNYSGAIAPLLAGVKSCPTDKEMWVTLGDSYYFADPKNKENVKKAKDAYLRAKNLGSRDGAEKYEQLSK
jgi:tetratricopeptide (TPR) repeat protein